MNFSTHENLFFKRFFLFIAAILSVSMLYAQTGITGKVLDENGQPLVGATVAVKGTTTAAVASLDGAFTLKVQGNAILVVSFLGYKTEQVSAVAGTPVSIKLEPEDADIDAVGRMAGG